MAALNDGLEGLLDEKGVYTRLDALERGMQEMKAFAYELAHTAQKKAVKEVHTCEAHSCM